jgi:hypothetical protein
MGNFADIVEIDIGSVANLKIIKNFQIVNIKTNPIAFVKMAIPSHWNKLFDFYPI